MTEIDKHIQINPDPLEEGQEDQSKSPEIMTSNQAKRLEIHEWLDKLAYGLIIAFAIMIYNRTETLDKNLAELMTGITKMEVRLDYNSDRIKQLEEKIAKYDENIQEFYRTYQLKEK